MLPPPLVLLLHERPLKGVSFTGGRGITNSVILNVGSRSFRAIIRQVAALLSGGDGKLSVSSFFKPSASTAPSLSLSTTSVAALSSFPCRPVDFISFRPFAVAVFVGFPPGGEGPAVGSGAAASAVRSGSSSGMVVVGDGEGGKGGTSDDSACSTRPGQKAVASLPPPSHLEQMAGTPGEKLVEMLLLVVGAVKIEVVLVESTPVGVLPAETGGGVGYLGVGAGTRIVVVVVVVVAAVVSGGGLFCFKGDGAAVGFDAAIGGGFSSFSVSASAVVGTSPALNAWRQQG